MPGIQENLVERVMKNMHVLGMTFHLRKTRVENESHVENESGVHVRNGTCRERKVRHRKHMDH